MPNAGHNVFADLQDERLYGETFVDQPVTLREVSDRIGVDLSKRRAVSGSCDPFRTDDESEVVSASRLRRIREQRRERATWGPEFSKR